MSCIAVIKGVINQTYSSYAVVDADPLNVVQVLELVKQHCADICSDLAKRNTECYDECFGIQLRLVKLKEDLKLKIIPGGASVVPRETPSETSASQFGGQEDTLGYSVIARVPGPREHLIAGIKALQNDVVALSKKVTGQGVIGQLHAEV